jgi:hypothetical protein
MPLQTRSIRNYFAFIRYQGKLTKRSLEPNWSTSIQGGPTEDPEPRSRDKQPERTAPRRPEAGTENRNAPFKRLQGEERARENAPKAKPSTPPARGNTEEKLEKIKTRNQN